jgi:thiol-disulfide isomerase/thioredoxin
MPLIHDRPSLLRAIACAALAACAFAVAPTEVGPAAAAEETKAAPGVPAAPRELVPWDQRGTYAALLAKAKKQKKLVFLDVYATWCGPCKMMDRQTYTDSAVAKAAKAFVNRKIDGEKGEGPSIAQRYAVNAYPTLLIVDGDGKERNRLVGFQQPARFARFLDDTRTGRGTVEGIQALIAKGENTAANRYALAGKLAERGEFTAASAELDQGLALDPQDAQGLGADAAIQIANQASATQAFDVAAAPLDKWLATVPETHARLDDVLLQSANVRANQGKHADALAALRRVLPRRPTDVNLLTSFARFWARTNQALDEALAAAEKAVEISKNDAGALDALAEVHGARGDWNLAVETAEKAVAQRPSDNYLRGQLEKYQEQAVANLKNKQP